MTTGITYKLAAGTFLRRLIVILIAMPSIAAAFPEVRFNLDGTVSYRGQTIRCKKTVIPAYDTRRVNFVPGNAAYNRQFMARYGVYRRQLRYSAFYNHMSRYRAAVRAVESLPIVGPPTVRPLPRFDQRPRSVKKS